MLYRNITKQVISDLDFFPVVGIIGPRQVGKTTLAKYVLHQVKAFEGSLYLDLEKDSDKRKLQDAENYLQFHQDKCIVIDEVQIMPEIFPLLRSLIDSNRRPGRFILLGSASPNIIKHSSETLAGRIAYNELTPFSLPEVLSNTSMSDHWLRGGFPDALLAKNWTQTWRWLKSFIDTFIYRDLQQLGYQTSPLLISRMLEMLSSLNGQILNKTDLARSIGVSQPTVSHYLDLLEGGFIINRLQPYFVNISKRLVKQPKIYIRDSGILHSILNIRSTEQLLGSPAIGASWESYVIEQIKRMLGDNGKLYFYRTHKGAECDLILINQNGNKFCIEIKRSNNQGVSKGFYEVLKDINPIHSYVIVPQGETYPMADKILVCNLEDFLQNILPKIEHA